MCGAALKQSTSLQTSLKTYTAGFSHTPPTRRQQKVTVLAKYNAKEDTHNTRPKTDSTWRLRHGLHPQAQVTKCPGHSTTLSRAAQITLCCEDLARLQVQRGQGQCFEVGRCLRSTQNHRAHGCSRTIVQRKSPRSMQACKPHSQTVLAVQLSALTAVPAAS